MVQSTPTMADDGPDGSLSPAAVRNQYRSLETNVFEALLTPKSRALILSVLVENHVDGVGALTAKELCDMRADLSVSTFNLHRDPLIELGVMREAGKRGNAMTYELNATHPVAQLFVMIENITAAGDTPLILDEEFIADE